MPGLPAELDPRPKVEAEAGAWRVVGARCASCGYVSAFHRPRCPRCHARLEVASFGPEGRVWSSTVVHVSVAKRTPPYGLAYVDLNSGPRILAQVLVSKNGPLPVGSRVRLAGVNELGDICVEPAP